MRKIHFAGRLAILAALCVATASAVHAAEIRIGYSQDVLTLDPGNHNKRETETVIRNIYDGLVTRDANMKVVPEIAESWRQIDPVTYEFKLRKGVVFHNGSPLTAIDVAFTYNRLIKDGALDGTTSPRKGLVGPLKEVEVLDPLTVRFKLSQPSPIFIPMMPFTQIVSKAFTEKQGPNGLSTKEDGAGPFKLAQWTRGDSIVLERFDKYYGGAAAIPPVGPAKVDRVVFKVIPDSSARVAALLAGEVQLINELPVSAINQVEKNDKTKVVVVNGTRTFYVSLNNDKPPFNDKRVRQALNHAVNKPLIIEKLLRGNATALNGVLSPAAFAFNPNLREYEYNPTQAKKLLADAGYANGFDAVIDVDGSFKEIAEAIAAMMRQVGVRARVQVWEGSVITPIWRQSRASRKDRDMFFNSWGNGALDPADIVPANLRSNGAGNSAGYNNAKVDQLIDAADNEVDQAKRAEMYKDVQKLVNDDAPWVFLWVPQDIYGVAKNLRGWSPMSDSRINLHDAYLE